MNTQEDTATRLLRVPSYVAIFSGALPSQQELENFQQRHPASQQ
jgi:hypothetical protein